MQVHKHGFHSCSPCPYVTTNSGAYDFGLSPRWGIWRTTCARSLRPAPAGPVRPRSRRLPSQHRGSRASARCGIRRWPARAHLRRATKIEFPGDGGLRIEANSTVTGTVNCTRDGVGNLNSISLLSSVFLSASLSRCVDSASVCRLRTTASCTIFGVVEGGPLAARVLPNTCDVLANVFQQDTIGLRIRLHNGCASPSTRSRSAGWRPPSVTTSTRRCRRSCTSISSPPSANPDFPVGNDTNRSTSLTSLVSPLAMEPNTRTLRIPCRLASARISARWFSSQRMNCGFSCGWMLRSVMHPSLSCK